MEFDGFFRVESRVYVSFKFSFQELFFNLKCYFREKFGLYHVDFNDPNRKRTAKASAKAYSRIAKTNVVDWNHIPTPDVWISPKSDSSTQNTAAQTALLSTAVLTIVSIAFQRIF